MEIEYKNTKLKKMLSSPLSIIQNYGTLAKNIKKRLDEFKAATNLQDIQKLSYTNLHQLKGNFKNCFAVDVSANYRIIITLAHDPTPLKEDGGIDLLSITKIKIIEISDYH